MGEDEAHWRRALEQSRSAPFAPDGLRKAADQALESGFLQYAFDIRPHVMPEFLAQYVHSPDSRDPTRETNTALSSSAGHLTRAEQTVDTMPNTRDGIARAIEKRSPVDIDGTSFTLTLTELKKSLPHEVKYIEVLFMALSTDARHNGMLHIGPDNYTDDEIADLAVNTIRHRSRQASAKYVLSYLNHRQSPSTPRALKWFAVFSSLGRNRYSDSSENGEGGGNTKSVRLKI